MTGSRPAPTSDLGEVRPRSQPVRVNRDRRNHTARAALVDRIRGEFREMRGLSITVDQAARLFGVPSSACARILGGMAGEGLLHLRTDGRYVLLRDWSR